MHTKLLIPLFLLLLLAACAGTPTPVPTPPATPTAASPHPTPTAAPPTPTPRSEPPWPTLLRTLDFGVPAGNSYGPRALALHPRLDRLYVRAHSRTPAAEEKGLVVVLDPASGQVLARVETGPDTYAEGALLVDARRDRVYAVNADDGTCSVLDAVSLEPLTTLDDAAHLALDAEGGRLYVGGAGGLRLLDAETYAPLAQAPWPPDWQPLALAVDPVAGRLYLTGRGSAGYALHLYDPDTLAADAATALPGRPAHLLAAPGRQRVFITLDDGERNLLWTLDAGGELLAEQPLGDWLQDSPLALDAEGGRLFLGRDAYGDYGLTVLDPASGRTVADIPLTAAPAALAWDGKRARLLVSHTYAHGVRVVDVDAGQEGDFFATALDLVDLAVDPERGLLYVTDSAGWLRILDGESGAESARLPGAGRISVDAPHGRFYTGGPMSDRVRIFDADALTQTAAIRSRAIPVADAYHGGLYLVRRGVYLADLETLTVTRAISDTLPQNPGFSPNPAAVDALVDPGSGRLFVLINNGVPGSNNGNYLYVYEPETYQKVLTDTERSPGPLAVDPTTGRAYVSRIHLAGRSTSLLEGGRTYTARLDSVYGDLGVDPALGRLYLTVYGEQEGQLMVLDAANLDVLGSLPIPGGFGLQAVDPRRHLLYLATKGGQVQIWAAQGGDLPPPADPLPADLSAGEGPSRLFLPPGGDLLFALDWSYRLYRSDDGGRTWGRVGGGLPAQWVLDLAFSPHFAQDRTLWAGLATGDQGFGVWQSTDGGRSWRMVGRGLTDLAVTHLAVSPAFARDRTLFALARRGGLYRSTDGGQHWTALTDRYRDPDAYTLPPDGLTLSPTYGRDRTLFVGHGSLYRSTDGGESWTAITGTAQVALSPNFAADQTLYAWSSRGGLQRSTDGGGSWTRLDGSLPLTERGRGQVLVAPDDATGRTLYFWWTPGPPDAPPRLFRSTDGGESWEEATGGLLPAATPFLLTADGRAFVALDAAARPVRRPVAEMQWQPLPTPGQSRPSFPTSAHRKGAGFAGKRLILHGFSPRPRRLGGGAAAGEDERTGPTPATPARCETL